MTREGEGDEIRGNIQEKLKLEVFMSLTNCLSVFLYVRSVSDSFQFLSIVCCFENGLMILAAFKSVHTVAYLTVFLSLGLNLDNFVHFQL